MAFLDLWNRLKQSPSFRPNRIEIPAGQTDKDAAFFTPLTPGKHYFSIRVNEVFLSYQRKWLSEYDPMVLSVAEFNYNGNRVTAPFVVGPALMKDKMEQIPDGMVFKDTRVAGLHPYTGGSLTLSLVLCRIRYSDYIRKLLEVVESTSATYTTSFNTVITEYVKVAKVVLTGIESLFSMKETEALVGVRREIDPDAGDAFRAGYHVLLNADNSKWQPEKFWVRDNSLYYGDTAATAQPFRDEDYILYSITATPSRSDVDTLPFHQSWKDLNKYATELVTITDDQWQIIKGKLFAIQSVLNTSPDLTTEQSRSIFQDYVKQITEIKAGKNFLSGLESKSTPEPWEAEALAILKM